MTTRVVAEEADSGASAETSVTEAGSAEVLAEDLAEDTVRVGKLQKNGDEVLTLSKCL